LGSVATAFSRAGGNIAGELAACQRYYLRYNSTNGLPLVNYGTFVSTTIYENAIPLPVQMRITPSVLDASTIYAYDVVSTSSYNSGSFACFGGNPNLAVVRYTHGSAAFTAGRPGYLYPSPTGYLGFTAEL